MQIETEINGKKRTIEVKKPLGKTRKEYLKGMGEVTKAKDSTEAADKMVSLQEKMIMIHTGLTQEEIDEMPVEDQQKILDYIDNVFSMSKEKNADFLGNSKMPRSS